jgi:hypothetical protein
MGVRDVLGLDPVEIAKDTVGNATEKQRKENFARRVHLYRDDAKDAVYWLVQQLFHDATVRDRMAKFTRISCANSLYKRVIDEIGGHVYSIPPRRHVSTPDLATIAPEDITSLPENPDDEAFQKLAGECRQDEVMDQACRMVHACNTVLVHYRYVPRFEEMRAEVLTPDQVSIVPDPDDYSRPLAVIYQSWIWFEGKQRICQVYWDDSIRLRFFADSSGVIDQTANPLGVLPFITIHRKRPQGFFWDTSSGDDLVYGSMLSGLLLALTARLHKTQGWKRERIIGDPATIPRSQLLDEECPQVFPEGTQVLTDPPTSAAHYLDTIEHLTTTLAANYGINRDRLNQKSSGIVAEAGLLERRQAAIRIFRQAEMDAFALVRTITNAEGSARISDDARLNIDFAEVEALADRQTQLKISQEMEHRGLRSVLDDIAELNPEYKTDQERMAKYLGNIEILKWRKRAMRDINAPDGGQDPGLEPQVNGALGPVARDEGTDIAQRILNKFRDPEGNA